MFMHDSFGGNGTHDLEVTIRVTVPQRFNLQGLVWERNTCVRRYQFQCFVTCDVKFGRNSGQHLCLRAFLLALRAVGIFLFK